MRRRRLLAGVAGAAGAGLAGCLAPAASDASEGRSGGTGGATARQSGDSLAARGFPPTVCEESVDPGGLRAVVDPVFGPDWDDVAVDSRYATVGRVRDDGSLGADAVVVGLTTADGTRARAYPLALLAVHEIVNDEFGGPVAVTYCPLCRSGVVFERRVDGDPTTFHISGLLWQPPEIQVRAAEGRGDAFGASARDTDADVRNQGNLVMYDAATESYWSQVLATAICGPLRGTDLALRPATVTTWGEWRAEHPGSEVLLPPPASGLD